MPVGTCYNPLQFCAWEFGRRRSHDRIVEEFLRNVALLVVVVNQPCNVVVFSVLDLDIRLRIIVCAKCFGALDDVRLLASDDAARAVTLGVMACIRVVEVKETNQFSL